MSMKFVLAGIAAAAALIGGASAQENAVRLQLGGERGAGAATLTTERSVRIIRGAARAPSIDSELAGAAPTATMRIVEKRIVIVNDARKIRPLRTQGFYSGTGPKSRRYTQGFYSGQKPDYPRF